MKTYGDYTREDFDTFGSPFDFEPSAPAPVKNLCTDKQSRFLFRLASERGYTNPGPTTYIMTSPDGRTVDFSKLTKHEASAMIEKLLQTPKVPAPGKTSRPVSKVEVTEGMYQDPESQEIFKVQRAIHGSGKLYAKILVVDEEATFDDNGKMIRPAVVVFEMAEGVVYQLRPEWKLTIEDAKRFGALYGVCMRCARTLTLEESIERAMGRICASKF